MHRRGRRLKYVGVKKIHSRALAKPNDCHAMLLSSFRAVDHWGGEGVGCGTQCVALSVDGVY
jgi:hypothetical protein